MVAAPEIRAGFRPSPAAVSQAPALNAASPLRPLPPAEAALQATNVSDENLAAAFASRVNVIDGGDPARRAVLSQAFERMLESPTARELVRQFLAEGISTDVEFTGIGESRVQIENGRKIFSGQRGVVAWQNGRVRVRLNKDYVDVDEHIHEQNLPATLAHEILGHGLGYARADRADVFHAFHVHELNEMKARLVEWLVDLELDGRIEDASVWRYLDDAGDYYRYLKLRLPYYAVTFSNAEFLHPLAALEKRLEAARIKRTTVETDLRSHLSWHPVIDHFAVRHNIPESRFSALQAHMANAAQLYRDDLSRLDDVIAAIAEMATALSSAVGLEAQALLREAAASPFFQRLQTETDALARRLAEKIHRAGGAPAESEEELRRRAEHWRGQITFERLQAMYEKDRLKHPDHWQR
jgi:plasmid stabilization system protein ParE